MVDIDVDTSAAMKLVVAGPGREELAALLHAPERRVLALWLLHTELHCAAGRRPEAISLDRLRGAPRPPRPAPPRRPVR